METEELERREKIERHKEDMIRQIAASTGQSAQMLRAMSRGQYVPSSDTLAYSRSQGIDQMAQPHDYSLEDENRRMYADRRGMMRSQINQ